MRTTASEVARAFHVPLLPALEAHYNIAPTQQVLAVRQNRESGARELVPLHWGLIPSWADDPSIGNRMINARAETVATKPAFRQAFRSRRCLVVADGFYEWQRVGSRKQPFHIALKSAEPFGFAGLWEHWERGELKIDSCTVITTEANEMVRPIHDRMPVIVAPDDWDTWLDPQCQDTKQLQSLLRPYPAEAMDLYPVSPLVNNPRNDLAECLERLNDRQLFD